MNVSPSKRRVLGCLDVNVPSPKAHPKSAKDAKTGATFSPRKPTSPTAALQPSAAPELDAQKRPSTMAGSEPPAKKQCHSTPERELQSAALADEARRVDGAGPASQREPGRQHSASPAPSSVFDASGIDTSQATNLTEPDHDIAAAAAVTAQLPPVAPRPRRRLTQAESKEVANRLRLRMDLARYKIATGQTDVPLEQLVQKPMPQALRRSPKDESGHTPAAAAGAREVSPTSSQSSCEDSDEVQADEDEERSSSSAATARPVLASPEKGALPRLPPPSATFTPRRRHMEEEDDLKLTSSALRGGAANGLVRLSLARC